MVYATGVLKAGGNILLSVLNNYRSIMVHNLGVKKFRSLIRKRKKNTEDFVAHQVHMINHMTINSTTRPQPH